MIYKHLIRTSVVYYQNFSRKIKKLLGFVRTH